MAGAGWTVSIAIPFNNANIQQGLRILLSHIFASPPLQQKFLCNTLFSNEHWQILCISPSAVAVYSCSIQLQYTVQYTVQVHNTVYSASAE